METPMVSLEHIVKSFTGKDAAVHAVSDVSLSIEKGSIYGIVGFSGAGKSTLVRCINLLERPTSGRVFVDGTELTALRGRALGEQRRKIGMIFQQFNLFATRTVYDNVAFPLCYTGLSGQQIRAKVTDLLRYVDLSEKENAYPSQLSGGQKQRVAIARALASDPKVLLCDEATSALAGARPVVDLHYADFLGVCMDEIFNQMAKARYMSGAQASIPLVLRAPDGLIGQGAAQHSQSVESWVTHIPGLKVVAPSNAADAKAVLKAAIRDPNPVIYFEHKCLFRQTFDVPAIEDEQPYEIGRARIVRTGSDVTLVSYSRTLQTVLRASEALADSGIEAEVIDLISLSPWDKETVLSSVQKTGRLCICHEAVRQSGFGAEIAAVIAQEAFHALKAPIVRLGAPFTPVPFSPGLEDQVRVHEADIVSAVQSIC